MQWWHVLTIGAVILALYKSTSAGAGFTVKRIAQAIAVAEGYGVAGAIPTVRNNPGNIRSAAGPIATYDSAAAGWDALYTQVARMLAGSSLYPPTWNIEQVAARYTGEAAYMNWARIVAGELGVSTLTTFSELA
jgi:hypothetical protein